MARTLTVDELEKAARNLERIESYLVSRTTWSVPPASRDAIASSRRSIDGLAARTRAWAPAGTLDPPEAEPAPPPDGLPQDSLDSDQLAGFASFLERLDRWFASTNASPPEGTDPESPAARLSRSVEAVQRALALIAGDPAPARTDDDHTAVAAGRRAGPAAVVDDVYAGAPRRDSEAVAAPPKQIAFTSAEPEPMFRWVDAENIELTALARERIEELFADQGVAYFRYQLENFAEEVARRVRNAPEGHVLVVKVRDIGGERKPFLSYVAESALKSG